MSADALNSARLLFSEELARGIVGDDDLSNPSVDTAVRSRRFASRPRGRIERAAMKLGVLTYERHCLAPQISARQAVLGASGFGPPRFLLRVDEFPHARSLDARERYGPERFEMFEAIMRDHGIPYLLALTPHVSRDHLDPKAKGGRGLAEDEIAILRALDTDRVTLALHGYDHRSRVGSPRRRSELTGLDAYGLRSLLDRATSTLASLEIRPSVFVPPFNRFDSGQYELLAERYDVICGGPETVAVVGFHRTPQWRGNAVFMPAYPPLYDHSSAMLKAVARVVDAAPGTWVPLVLHWGWEADAGWEPVKRLAEAVAPYASSWDRFLGTVAEIRAVEAAAAPGESR